MTKRLEKEIGVMDELRARVAQLEARNAELEAALRVLYDKGLKDDREESVRLQIASLGPMWPRFVQARAALASDGSKALAAVRMAQEQLRKSSVGRDDNCWCDPTGVGPHLEPCASIRAAGAVLRNAFGESE